MSQVPEPQLVEGQEHARVDEQVARSTAGVEQHERVVTDGAGLQHRERTVNDVGAEYQMRLNKVAQVLWLLVGIVEVLIGVRVLLKLIGANPDNDFAGFVYNAAALFLAPFFGLIGSPAAGGMVLEIPSLIAMLVYGLLGWGIIRVVLPLFVRPTTSSTSTYDRRTN